MGLSATNLFALAFLPSVVAAGVIVAHLRKIRPRRNIALEIIGGVLIAAPVFLYMLVFQEKSELIEAEFQFLIILGFGGLLALPVVVKLPEKRIVRISRLVTSVVIVIPVMAYAAWQLIGNHILSHHVVEGTITDKLVYRDRRIIVFKIYVDGHRYTTVRPVYDAPSADSMSAPKSAPRPIGSFPFNHSSKFNSFDLAGHNAI